MDLNLAYSFLTDLKKNNNREWFQDNKKRYEEARKQFIELLDNVIVELSKFDSSVANVTSKESIFRIYRDVRFSKDKSPYKTHFGGFVCKEGRKSQWPGYYVHFEPGATFAGGGVYGPQPIVLKALRSEIYYNAPEFKKIINSKKFKDTFGGLSIMDDMLKKAPKDFPADFEDIELLRHKHYVCGVNLKDNEITKPELLGTLTDVFKAQYPLNKFLARGIENME